MRLLYLILCGSGSDVPVLRSQQKCVSGVETKSVKAFSYSGHRDDMKDDSCTFPLISGPFHLQVGHFLENFGNCLLN